ncbi:hypothetical protein [Vibrio coralliilyticus]|uniref:hypothetical protein n=1 Tax=Vibrio coralliilyticus TaxID=190893 RepID=UPI001C105B3F|nr:hypothetical protein [Vibrio coralliilyticus]
MSSVVNQHGWIIVDVPEAAEIAAKKHRQARDQKYGNIYSEKETDERWVGDLGEFVFKSWLKSQRFHQFEWILDDAAGKADFIMPQNSLVDVKTVKRKVAPRPDYTAQITAQHIEENIDHYFFMSYQNSLRKMTLLGGVSKKAFKEHSVYYGEGDMVHSNYTIRKGHEIYNIDIAKLVSPHEWLAQFTP